MQDLGEVPLRDVIGPPGQVIGLPGDAIWDVIGPSGGGKELWVILSELWGNTAGCHRTSGGGTAGCHRTSGEAQRDVIGPPGEAQRDVIGPPRGHSGMS